MATFTADKLRRIMDNTHNIRNVSVIGDLNHGKSTLTDSLVEVSGIIVDDDARKTDTRGDEAECDITIKSTGISLYYKMTDYSLKNYRGDQQGYDYLINLVDDPCALGISDGALVVVDCVEGVSPRTGTLLKRALGERIRPVLTLNKVDKCFLDFQMDGEQTYQTFKSVIEDANAVMASHVDDHPLLGADLQFCPKKGNVAFSSGLHGWAFTLTGLAKLYVSMGSRLDESDMVERLWGEHFFDRETRKWTRKHTVSPTCERGFVILCYNPMKIMINDYKNQTDKVWELIRFYGVSIKPADKGDALMKRSMENLFRSCNYILEMMIYHLPSPARAQKYSVDKLYTGPSRDAYAFGIRNCDPEGPLVLFLSRTVSSAEADRDRFFALGRVFSGKVSTGSMFRIVAPDYKEILCGSKIEITGNDLYVESVETSIVPCGNLVAIVGLDDEFMITEAVTLTEIEVQFMIKTCNLLGKFLH